MIDRKMQDVSCDCILVDNEGAARDAVKRLVNAGHRKIGMIAGPEDIYTAKERLKGFRAAVREAGADTDEALIAGEIIRSKAARLPCGNCMNRIRI